MIVIVSTREPYKTINFDYPKLKSVVDFVITKATPNLSGKYMIEFESENLMVSPMLNMKHFYCYKYSLESQDNPFDNLSLYVTFDEGGDNLNLYVGRAGKQAAIKVENIEKILDIENLKSTLENPSFRFVYTYGE